MDPVGYRPATVLDGPVLDGLGLRRLRRVQLSNDTYRRSAAPAGGSAAHQESDGYLDRQGEDLRRHRLISFPMEDSRVIADSTEAAMADSATLFLRARGLSKSF